MWPALSVAHRQCRQIATAIFLALGLVTPVPAAANEIFDARGFIPQRQFFNPLPFERVDPMTGNLLLTFTDLVLPGNAGLDLRIQRHYNSKIYRNYQQLGDTVLDEDSWAGIGWTLHFGRVFWPDGNPPGPIEMPDGGQHKLFLQNDGSGRFITRDFWIYDRNQGVPFLMQPNGVKYTFGRGVVLSNGVAARYVTQIRDPFGNTIDITYMSSPADGIQRVTQNLGNGQVRDVTFTTDGFNGLRTMTFTTPLGSHTWTYEQITNTVSGFSFLSSVRPPVGPAWVYWYSDGYPNPRNILRAITTPHGGQINYTYRDETFYQQNYPGIRSPAISRRELSGRGLAGGTWDFSYNGGNGVTTITSPCGVSTRYEYNGVGLFPTPGRVWEVGLMRSRTVSSSSGTFETETLTWDPSVPISNSSDVIGTARDTAIFVPLLRSHTVTRGGQTFSTAHSYNTTNYSDYGRPYRTEEVGSLSRTTARTFQYGFHFYLAARLASETVTVGSESFTKSYAYNLSNGFKTSDTIYGVTTSYSPTPQGNLQSTTNGNGHTTSFDYSWGTVSTVYRPLYQIPRQINAEGTIASETRRGFTTTFQYDLLLRPTRTTPPVGNPIVTEYDNSAGTYTRVIRGPSRVTTTLDGFGRPIGTSNTVGVQTTTTYDACGRKTYESYPFTGANIGTSFQYDALDRHARRINPDGTDVVYQYSGIDVDIRDENGRIAHQDRTAFGNPDETRLASVTDPYGQTTSYTYNALDELATVVDPVGRSRTWVRNNKNQVTFETHPERDPVSYAYDSAGNLSASADNTFGQTRYRYDANERLIEILRPGAGQIPGRMTVIRYDASDNRTEVDDGHVISVFAYDGANRLTGRRDMINPDSPINRSSFDVAYYNDNNDNLSSITYAETDVPRRPSERVYVGYDRDSEGRITRIHDTFSIIHAGQIGYHPSGAVESFKPGGSNSSQSFSYDTRYRLQRINTGKRDLQYSYDAVGNVMGISDTRPGMSQGFGYDSLDRLTSASGAWGSGVFGYDSVGNRLINTVGVATTYSYDTSTNRLVGTSLGAAFSYDVNGNVVHDGTRAYTYTPTNMTETAGGTTYRYDADDLRKMKISPDGSVRYFIHGPGGQLLSEFEQACPAERIHPVRDYIYLGGRLIASVRHVGTTRISLDSASSTATEGGGSHDVTLTLTTADGAPTPCPTSVSLSTANMTATAGADYLGQTASFSFPAGTASGTQRVITVPIVSDALDEDDETFTVNLTATGATAGTAIHTVTILDDDPLPSLLFWGASIHEGDSGTRDLVFTLALSAPSGRTVRASYGTSDLTAVAAQDYVSMPGTVAFSPGSLQATVTIPVIGDKIPEAIESFVLTLSEPSNVTLNQTQVLGQVLDDDSVASAQFIRHDFDGDGLADVGVYRSTTGEWIVLNSSNLSTTAVAWGCPTCGDVPMPGDYDGDGKTDIGIYRVPTADWIIRRSSDWTTFHVSWGWFAGGDIPVPADYDGDGRTDVAVYRVPTGEWFIRRSSDGGGMFQPWGCAPCDDVPVPADYDGDGRADIAVFRRSSGDWFILQSSTWTMRAQSWGAPSLGDVPVPANYTVSGQVDIAIFRRSTAEWIIQRANDFGTTVWQWGAPSLGDIPIPANFSRPSTTDIGIYRGSTGEWIILRYDGTLLYWQWGAPSLGDVPL